MPEPDNADTPHPLQQLMALATGYWASAALSAAVQLELFPAIAKGGDAGIDAAHLAADAQASPRHLAALLDALTGAGLLRKRDDRYQLHPDHQPCLDPASPTCMLDALRFNLDMYPLWGKLDQCVRAGQPVVPPRAHLGEDPQRTARFVRGMNSRALPMAPAITAAIDLAGCANLLDVGSGPGAFSRDLANANPSLSVTQFDLPGVLDVARDLAHRHPAAQRITYHTGDYRQDQLPTGFDAILYCGALHQESPDTARDLFRKLRQSLNPRGRLFVVDMMLDHTATQPLFSALFSLNMMLFSPIARVFTIDHARDLLTEAGFREAMGHPVPNTPYHLLHASR